VWLLTDRQVAGGIDGLIERVAAVSQALPEAVGVVLRDKDLPAEARLRLGRRLRQLTRGPLLVARDLALAEAIAADGLLLEDGQPAPGARGQVGLATHAAAAASRALLAGAAHVTLSPIWPTASKPGVPALGPAALTRVVRPRRGLLLALGGIDGAGRAAEARAAGADGVAVIRAILAAPDPVAAAMALVAACA
jgi:thiamine-phosphate pyrophosphorylase